MSNAVKVVTVSLESSTRIIKNSTAILEVLALFARLAKSGDSVEVALGLANGKVVLLETEDESFSITVG